MLFSLRTFLNTASLLMGSVLFVGCASITGTETSYKPWRGDNIYQGQGGAVDVVNGIEMWVHGDPDKPYKVIGIITQSKSDDWGEKLLFGNYSKKLITDIVLREKGDGVITMSSERFVSGYTTDMPMTQYGTATTSRNYSTASILAVFRSVEMRNDSNQ